MIGNNGRVQGRQVVPSRVLASLRESAGNNAIASKGNVERLTLHQGMTYKSYWFQGNDGKGSLELGGVYGQHIHSNPKDRLTIVQFGSTTHAHRDGQN